MPYRLANGKDEFYSRMGRGEFVELFLDHAGFPTVDYPHIHVVHLSSGDVHVVASFNRVVHGARKILLRASGQEVQAAILAASLVLETVKVYRILDRAKEQVGSVVFVPHEGVWVCSRIYFNG